MSNWSSGEILSKDKLNEMEDKLSSVTSTYNKTTWNDGDIVTADKLNNLENGISTFIPTYSKHTWVDDEEITSDKLNNLDIQIKASKGIYNIGDVVIKDGIESVCVYKEKTRQDWGQYLFVDKNHDLCYYITGLDYVNSNEYDKGLWNPEWGAYKQNAGMQNNYSLYRQFGQGLNNTNLLISMDLQPETKSWPLLWEWVETFRLTHSNDWFIPTYTELLEIYNQKDYLEKLSTEEYPSYWTSLEIDNFRASGVFIHSGNSSNPYKNSHDSRVRLCFYL